MESGKFRPVYYLQGEEPFFIDSLTRYVEENALSEADRSFNQLILYGKDAGMDQIISQAQQHPMMGERMVVIVKEAQNLKPDDELIRYLANPVKSTVLLFAHKGKGINKSTKAYKALKSDAVVVNSNPMKEWQLRDWMPDFLKDNFEINIDPPALQLLMEFQGTEIQKLVNEVGKIKIKNNRPNIAVEDVQQNIGFGKDFDLFEVQTALAARDKKTLTRIVMYFDTMMKTSHMIGINAILYTYFSQAFVLSMPRNSRKNVRAELGIGDWMYKKLKVGIDNYGYKLAQVLAIIKEYELRSKGINSQEKSSAELLKEMLFKIVNL